MTAIRRSNCMILGADHPPFVWVSYCALSDVGLHQVVADGVAHHACGVVQNQALTDWYMCLPTSVRPPSGDHCAEAPSANPARRDAWKLPVATVS